jgi:hypothetical protein
MPEEKRVNVPKVVSSRRPQHKPKLGQHFLASDSFALQIVDALGEISQNSVLEIGPGRGVLTSLLAKRVRRLIAVELDRVLAAQLRLRFGMFSNVEVIEADILSIDFDSLFGPKPGLRRPGIEFRPEPVKVIGNLPYYITSDILLRLFDYSKYFETIVILVQREVADRLAAEPAAAITDCSPPPCSSTPAWRNSSICRPERFHRRRRCIRPHCGSPCRRESMNWALTGMARRKTVSSTF